MAYNRFILHMTCGSGILEGLKRSLLGWVIHFNLHVISWGSWSWRFHFQNDGLFSTHLALYLYAPWFECILLSLSLNGVSSSRACPCAGSAQKKLYMSTSKRQKIEASRPDKNHTWTFHFHPILFVSAVIMPTLSHGDRDMDFIAWGRVSRSPHTKAYGLRDVVSYIFGKCILPQGQTEHLWSDYGLELISFQSFR